ncbi:putative trancriptional regulator, ArsR family [Halanaeroarchaeum sp. HSR-CO]|uniref:helix-turn-helix domain-containing protein n=1 Tax=Halanaeroarchaeum sp. HSR-CO TaxID=2866382 RepID=UPI00217D5135|nr:helix-turn-helix domain-containing protein [Halanaeroarchaeum sp. HSR-CO]UWG48502.1 putative trancriptional regulator, ArsR family [Halanaeroarchaeum sp. HSR-CO]
MTALDPGSGPSSIDDEVVSAVANEKRRRILQTLARSGDQTVSVDEVVEALDEHIGDHPDDRHHLAVALHHVHLPQLESVGLVHRPEKKRVRLADEQATEEVLDLIESFD